MYPKSGDLVMNKLIDWTHVCWKIWRRFVIRGESPIKPENSWFSAKSILVDCYLIIKKNEGKALFNIRGV